MLPSLTATDLQEVMKDVTYGPNEDQLTEDQVCIRRKRWERGSLRREEEWRKGQSGGNKRIKE